jgi:hypothetical protein
VRCYKTNEWGRCEQRSVAGYTFCGFHERRRQDGLPADRFYDEMVTKGFIEPTDHWMTPSETKAMFDGRRRGDGRRLDQWVE